jgi:hypothetical protein
MAPMKRLDWHVWHTDQTDKATKVEPSNLLKTTAMEIGILERYFSVVLPRSVLAQGRLALDGEFEQEKRVRVDIRERRIYFKLRAFQWHYERFERPRNWDGYALWLDEVTKYHPNDVTGVTGGAEIVMVSVYL